MSIENDLGDKSYKLGQYLRVDDRFSSKERHTLVNIYCALLTPQFTDCAVNKFSEEVDIVLMSENYEFIAKIVDKIGKSR